MNIRSAWRSNLRSRITLAMLAITAIGSAVFALGIYLSNEGLEDVVLEHQVREELNTMIQLANDYPLATTIESALIRGYVGRDNPDLPAELAALEPGDYHNVALGDARYQILVEERDGERYYVAYDITEWEDRERQMILILCAGVILLSIAAVWLGLWASRQIIAPVTRLADRVTAVQPNERDVRIASEFEGAEVHAIATAFDRFMARLDGFVAREQSFTEAASHELRTPLAVTQGAADILGEQPELSAISRRAVERIQRGSREMREFIDALLFLSREPATLSSGDNTCEISQIVSQLVEDYRALYAGGAVEITYEARNSLIVDVPPSLPTIVISNLIRNALEHTAQGSVEVTLDANVLTIRDTGTGIVAEHQEKMFERVFTTKEAGRGMGLYIVRRICDQCGCRVHFASNPGKGTTVTLHFRKCQGELLGSECEQ